MVLERATKSFSPFVVITNTPNNFVSKEPEWGSQGLSRPDLSSDS